MQSNCTLCVVVVIAMLAPGAVAKVVGGADLLDGNHLCQLPAAPLTMVQLTPPVPPVPSPDPALVTPDQGGTPQGPRPPERPRFRCPETRYVNCMPPVPESRRSTCSRAYLEWMKAHCPNAEVVY